MRISSISIQEQLRLKNLYDYDILDSVPEKEFDDLVELAALIYNCPIASISFIDETKQWFKAKKGLDMQAVERDATFCSHTILDNKILIVNDATKDHRFRENPYVTGDPGVRFYAGVPIVSAEGYNLGTVCVVDQEPRKLTEFQSKALSLISAQITKLLELRIENKLLKQHANAGIKDQQFFLQKTIHRNEEQALSFSTELHENIAQGLAATKFYLEIAENNPQPALIKKCRENLLKMIEATRVLSKKLFPSTITHSTYNDFAEDYFDRFMKETGIRIIHDFSNTDAIHEALHLVLYRIAEEQLTNIRQHAKATEIKINLTVNEAIEFSISDNGVGFDMHHFKRNYGLSKIVNLAEFYDGTIDLNSYVNAGCELRVSIPLLHKNTSPDFSQKTAAQIFV